VAGGHHPQEGALGRPLGEPADGRVLVRPVDAEPDPAEQRLEGLLVLGRELVAQLDEVRP
jgi:hypothetical protein